MESTETMDALEVEAPAKSPQAAPAMPLRSASRTKSGASERTRAVAFVGLTIALMAVSAWVVVPLGPVPFTLQMFAITFAIVVLPPKAAIAAIAGYLLLGAVGVPVFSGMRGGIGVLAGPTGGFLWGYALGVPVAALFLHLLGKHRNVVTDVAAGIIFTAVAYGCGCVQYMVVGQVDLLAAFMVSCAPFIVVDLCKIVAAVVCARAVKRVVG